MHSWKDRPHPVLLPINPEEHPTSNIPTPNIQWQRKSSLTSAFEVRCWTFDVFPRFRGRRNLQNLDANRGHEPVGIPLNRPPGTFSPTVGEGVGSLGSVGFHVKQEQNCATRLYGAMFRKPAFINPR